MDSAYGFTGREKEGSRTEGKRESKIRTSECFSFLFFLHEREKKSVRGNRDKMKALSPATV